MPPIIAEAMSSRSLIVAPVSVHSPRPAPSLIRWAIMRLAGESLMCHRWPLSPAPLGTNRGGRSRL